MSEISSNPDAVSPGRRTRYTAEFKLRIVEASFAPGASIARVAREHGLNANQLFNWRYQYRQGRLGPMAASSAMLPVTVSDSAPTCHPLPASSAAAQIELTLATVQIKIQGRPDPETLRLVLLAFAP